jgi:hypothetical protein
MLNNSNHFSVQRTKSSAVLRFIHLQRVLIPIPAAAPKKAKSAKKASPAKKAPLPSYSGHVSFQFFDRSGSANPGWYYTCQYKVALPAGGQVER